MNINLGFTSLLTLIFVIAKITGHLNWSWLWVFSPLWIGFAIAFILLLIVCIVGALADYK
jgi:hypothetical protein